MKLFYPLFIIFVLCNCNNQRKVTIKSKYSISLDSLKKIQSDSLSNMEEEPYGIDKNFAHPKAIELIPEDFFWSNYLNSSPFGSDEGDIALAEFRKWRKANPKAPLLEMLKLTIESVGNMKFEDYNDSLLETLKIQSQINDKHFEHSQYIYTLDVAVIGTGFGQLVDEGLIEKDCKRVISIAIQRQKKYLVIYSGTESTKNEIANLDILLRVLDKATSL